MGQLQENNIMNKLLQLSVSKLTDLVTMVTTVFRLTEIFSSRKTNANRVQVTLR